MLVKYCHLFYINQNSTKIYKKLRNEKFLSWEPIILYMCMYNKKLRLNVRKAKIEARLSETSEVLKY